MQATRTFRRMLLLLAGLPSVFIVSVSLKQAHAQQVAATATRELYAQLQPGQSEYDVRKLFGTAGVEFGGRGWPRLLRQVPGYRDNSIRVTGSDGMVYDLGIVPPDSPVAWKRWPALDGDGWIVVAFFWCGREPTVYRKARCRSLKGGYRGAVAEQS